MRRTRSYFDIITPRPAPDVVAITDCDGSVSVTNDAENVVDWLRELGVLRPGDRLIYRDTEHRWDEIKLTPELKFNGFRPLAASSVLDAVVLSRPL